MIDNQTIRVVRRGQTTQDTPQTSGIQRFEAISQRTVGSAGLWMGHTIAPAGVRSAPHHHGDSETAIYMLRGTATFFVGEGLRERIDVSAGDFFFIPPNCVHVESNLTDEDAELIVARSTQEPIVVNLSHDS